MTERDPLKQLAAFRVDIDDTTRARDLEAIRTELRRSSAEPSPVRRRWTLGIVVAMILAGPTAAIAGDDALPGDLLYPVKRAVEPFVQLFDRNVVAEHRVEELEGLIDRQTDDFEIEQRIEIARDAVADSDAPLLDRELDRLVDRWVADRPLPAPPVVDEPVSTTAPPSEPLRDQGDRRTEPPPVDPPPSTTTTLDRARSTDRSTTTTVPRDDDRPPTDDRARDTP